jgi:hypothetical protein
MTFRSNSFGFSTTLWSCKTPESCKTQKTPESCETQKTPQKYALTVRLDGSSQGQSKLRMTRPSLRVLTKQQLYIVGKAEHVYLIDYPFHEISQYMRNVTTLSINCGHGDLSQIKTLTNLQTLSVRNWRSQAELPADFFSQLGNLTELRFTNCLKELPDVRRLTKLKVLDLSHCDDLVRIPDLSGSPITSLNLTGCSSLAALPVLSVETTELLRRYHSDHMGNPTDLSLKTWIH